ncbi:MAG: prepilin-type N-terminal cleavage/methylation domain-containing protein [Nitrososphaerota archaeon]
MKSPRPTPRPAQRAFTLTELMVAVGIMGLIVTALYSIFSTTQRALRANVSQTDVTEGGRFAMELITRDLRRLSAAGQTPETNFLVTLSPAIGARPVSALGPEEVFDLAVKAVKSSISRDAGSGNGIDVLLYTREGLKTDETIQV